MTRRFGFAAAALVLSLLISLALAEGAARFYVYFVVEHGKLFEPDPDVGWVVLPNLDLVRKNPAGERWHVRTSARGFRSQADEFREGSSLRVLVLGDSFVFGQGVALEERFDSRFGVAHPDWSIVNQGVMGYGTDQQLIAAREGIGELRAGDVLLIVSYQNDLVDLMRRSHSGRAKPWFEIENGDLIEHAPQIGFAETVRDQSYLMARLLAMLAQTTLAHDEADLRLSGRVYRRLIEERTADAIARGVRVVLAYHTSPVFDDPETQTVRRAFESAVTRTCKSPRVECVALDDALMATRGPFPFQRDGHWNAAGHAVVASALDSTLAEISRP